MMVRNIDSAVVVAVAFWALFLTIFSESVTQFELVIHATMLKTRQHNDTYSLQSLLLASYRRSWRGRIDRIQACSRSEYERQ